MLSSGGLALNRVLLVALSLLPLSRAFPVVHSGVSNYSFPDDFMFGVSTSAFQIEGGWNEGGKDESVWDTYVHRHPAYIADHKNRDVADDSYLLWREDNELIKSLGVSGYRMSIAWTRILPNGTDNHINEEGVKYYRRIFDELLKANITPVVTLIHWDMPTPLMDLGGWANPKLVDYFEDYVRVVFELYGDIVKMWLTLNEPHVNCANSYILQGIGLYLCTHNSPSHKRGGLSPSSGNIIRLMMMMMMNSLLAHARAYRLYEMEFKPHQQGKVSLALGCFWGIPKDPNKPEDVTAAEDYLQMHVYPPGFRKVFNWLQNTYKIFKKIPIIITENGLTDKGQTEDYERVSYLNDYLYELLLAIREDGVNVKGYFCWSLMDDFEWTDGYTAKFGLFKVDYDSPNRTRTTKLSAKSYANIVRTRRIDFDYIKPPSVHNISSSLSAL